MLTARRVIAGEAAFLASGRSGVMLHPTMIYGAQGEDNVQRLAALLRRLPIVPLPGGGKALVQPIHQDDVTRAHPRRAGASHGMARTALVIAGPTAPALRRFRARRRTRGRPATAAHASRVPAWPLMARRLARGTSRCCRRSGPTKSAACWKTRHSTCAPMQQTLGVQPIRCRQGLRAPSLRSTTPDTRYRRTAPCRSSTASPSSTAR